MDPRHVGYTNTSKPGEPTKYRLRIDAGIVLLALLVLCTAYALAG